MECDKSYFSDKYMLNHLSSLDFAQRDLKVKTFVFIQFIKIKAWHFIQFVFVTEWDLSPDLNEICMKC